MNETIAGGSTVDAAISIAPDTAPISPRICVTVAWSVADSVPVDAARFGGSERAGSSDASVIDVVASVPGVPAPGPLPTTTVASVVVVVEVGVGYVVVVTACGRLDVVVVGSMVVVVVDFGTVVDVVVVFGWVVVVDVDVVDVVEVVDVVDVVVVVAGGSVGATTP